MYRSQTIDQRPENFKDYNEEIKIYSNGYFIQSTTKFYEFQQKRETEDFLNQLEKGEIPNKIIESIKINEEDDQTEIEVIISDYRPLNFLTPKDYDIQERLNKVYINKINRPEIVLNKSIKLPDIDDSEPVYTIKIRYVTGENLSFKANNSLKIRKLFEYVAR